MQVTGGGYRVGVRVAGGDPCIAPVSSLSGRNIVRKLAFATHTHTRALITFNMMHAH